MKVLVCGGRDYADRAFLFSTLNVIHAGGPISLLIEGGARGADNLASEWADLNHVPKHTFIAHWKEHGKAAGMIRNRQMLEEGQPDLVIAFAGGHGTAGMVAISKKAGVKVIEPQNAP